MTYRLPIDARQNKPFEIGRLHLRKWTYSFKGSRGNKTIDGKWWPFVIIRLSHLPVTLIFFRFSTDLMWVRLVWKSEEQWPRKVFDTLGVTRRPSSSVYSPRSPPSRNMRDEWWEWEKKQYAKPGNSRANVRRPIANILWAKKWASFLSKPGMKCV